MKSLLNVNSYSSQCTIVMLIGDYEPGRNGICDYTLSLAQSVAAKGYTIIVISLEDSGKNHEFQTTTPGVEVIRFSHLWSIQSKLRALLNIMSSYQNPILTIHFNIFCYNPRGLCVGWAAIFAALTHRYRTIFMFHELWVGSSVREPLKKTILGIAQACIVKSMMLISRPRLVHTSNPDYASRLKRCSTAPVNILPLFSNIPPQPSQPDLVPYHFPEVASISDSFVIGHFGSFNPYGKADWLGLFLESLFAEYKYILPISLLAFGKNTNAALLDRYRHRFPWNSFISLGPQSVELISQLLLSCDVGLCTTPFNMVGKSGAAAAYIDHGLPVLCCPIGYTHILNKQTSFNHVHPCLPELARRIMNLPRPPIESSVHRIASTFIEDLSIYSATTPV